MKENKKNRSSIKQAIETIIQVDEQQAYQKDLFYYDLEQTQKYLEFFSQQKEMNKLKQELVSLKRQNRKLRQENKRLQSRITQISFASEQHLKSLQMSPIIVYQDIGNLWGLQKIDSFLGQFQLTSNKSESQRFTEYSDKQNKQNKCYFQKKQLFQNIKVKKSLDQNNIQSKMKDMQKQNEILKKDLVILKKYIQKQSLPIREMKRIIEAII